MLMSQAKIYWDLDNYAQVEKVNDKSAVLFFNLEIVVGRLFCFVFFFQKKKRSSTTDKTSYMYLFSHYSHYVQADK